MIRLIHLLQIGYTLRVSDWQYNIPVINYAFTIHYPIHQSFRTIREDFMLF